jgi:hypothetical protein
LAHHRKLPAIDPADDWGPWSAAHFQDRESRDGFLQSVATAVESGWSAEPAPEDTRSAQVRWRPGRFLRLNDVAYAHGGRIVVVLPQISVQSR